jgi:hypothetical protein
MARRATAQVEKLPRYTEDCSIARLIYADPDPKRVARLAASHDWEACLARWHWVDARKLGAIARVGRGMLGWSTGVTRQRSTNIGQEAALIETAYLLSNQGSAEVAGGVREATMQTVFDAWGIPLSDRPRPTPEERGAATRIGRAVAAGEAWAMEANENRRAHERAVYEVVAASLALMPEPKPFGRPPMPEPSDALRAAVSGFPPAAIAAVHPGLFPATAFEEQRVMTSTASIATTAPGRIGRCPDDETLRARLDAGTSVADIATEFGVTPAAIYQKRKALSVRAPAGPVEVTARPAPEPAAPAEEERRQVPVAAAVPAPEPVRTVVTVHAGAGELISNPLPLALEGLLRAREVILACGCHPMEAIGLVRADVAHVRHESASA